MKRKTLISLAVLLLFSLAVVACSGDSNTPTETEALQVDASSPVVATEVPTAELPESTEAPSLADLGPKPGCTVVSLQPTPGPELVTLFTPGENDWVYGPETAAVTIVEYSDFQ